MPEGDQFQMDAVAVGFVVFALASAGYSVLVGDEEAAEGGVFISGEAVAVEDSGRSVPRTSWEKGAG